MKSLFAMFCVGLTLSFAAPLAFAKGPNPEATQEVRNTAALDTLKGTSDVVAVYAQGLCCASCAIGVKKKVRGLEFVDLDRLDEGVKLDAKTQLVTIALKKGQNVDAKMLTQAIKDAGYEPIHLYTLKGGKLNTEKLASK